MDSLVPVIFTVSVERREHDGQNGGRVITYQTHNVPEKFATQLHFVDAANFIENLQTNFCHTS